MLADTTNREVQGGVLRGEEQKAASMEGNEGNRPNSDECTWRVQSLVVSLPSFAYPGGFNQKQTKRSCEIESIKSKFG